MSSRSCLASLVPNHACTHTQELASIGPLSIACATARGKAEIKIGADALWFTSKQGVLTTIPFSNVATTIRTPHPHPHKKQELLVVILKEPQGKLTQVTANRRPLRVSTKHHGGAAWC